MRRIPSSAALVLWSIAHLLTCKDNWFQSLFLFGKKCCSSYRHPGSLFKEDSVEEIEALSNRVGGDHDPKPPYLRLQWSKDGSRAAEVYCFCCSGCSGEQEATAAGGKARLLQGETSGLLLLPRRSTERQVGGEWQPLSTVFLLRSMIVRQKPSERPAPEDDTC